MIFGKETFERKKQQQEHLKADLRLFSLYFQKCSDVFLKSFTISKKIYIGF